MGNDLDDTDSVSGPTNIAADGAVAQIRALLDERVRAVADRDATSLIESNAPDVLNFPLLPPAVTMGREPVADSISMWFGGYTVGPGYDVTEVHIAAVAGFGYCAFRYHVTGTLDSGDEVDMWVRATLVCREVDGVWMVVHDHESVPFDPASGMALIALGPGS